MIDSDKKLFKQTIDTMCDSFNMSRFPKELLLEWYENLIDYPIDNLITKIDLFCEEHGKPPLLCELIDKPKVTIKPKNPTPLTMENNKKHMAEVKEDISKMKSKKDKEWARRIIANEKAYPQIAVKFAMQALNMEEV